MMYSAEGEGVPFKKEMYPRGNVEDWLLEVENEMKESLRQIMGEALADYQLPEVSGNLNMIIGFKILWLHFTIMILEGKNNIVQHETAKCLNFPAIICREVIVYSQSLELTGER